MQIKSGTNTLRGTVSAYHTDGALKAKNALSQLEQPYTKLTHGAFAPPALFGTATVGDSEGPLHPTVNAFVTAGDGQRFLVAMGTRDPKAPPVSVVVNWQARLIR